MSCMYTCNLHVCIVVFYYLHGTFIFKHVHVFNLDLPYIFMCDVNLLSSVMCCLVLHERQNETDDSWRGYFLCVAGTGSRSNILK